MSSHPYYFAYENRYQVVYSAGVDRWGHSPDDTVLYNYLKSWVEQNDLAGKRVIEFACGEGACGAILSDLGCVYHGIDVSPSAIEKARSTLCSYQNASVEVLDMVKGPIEGEYDAALDCMGLHMLITDADRAGYLHNAYSVLKDGAPMLFFRESYRREGVYSGTVDSFAQWSKITGDDYVTPQPRLVTRSDNGEVAEVFVPLLPARAKDKNGYIIEFENAGFLVERFEEMGSSSAIPFSASIFVRKGV